MNPAGLVAILSAVAGVAEEGGMVVATERTVSGRRNVEENPSH
jgi:hypothetical protein